jgi:delta24-sterol reductase
MSQCMVRQEARSDIIVLGWTAMVTMEELVKCTLRYKLIPKVVAEFRCISVGGAISGASSESTSHKYGLFFECCAWKNMRLGDGKIVRTNRGEELWSSLSGTYGTMGVVLEAAVECVKAKPYV